MTKNDKLLLIYFLTHTGMYIYPVDLNNIQSFVTGYEIGRKNKCHFLDSLKDILTAKYKIKYLSTGWPGQIKRLSEKQSLSHVVTFKRTALDTITSNTPEGLDSKMQAVLRTRIISVINRINKAGDPWYNETWKDEWLSLTAINSAWFKLLWTKKQRSILKAINNEVLKDNLFKNKKSKLPSAAMLTLKIKFESLPEHPAQGKRIGK